MKKIVLIVCLVLFSITVQSQKKIQKLQFEVAGVCEMCKERIERAALLTDGVKSADWNIKTHILTIIYNQYTTDPLTIKTNVALSGHSSREVQATDEAYESLNACCKYNDPKVVEDHK